MSRDIEEQATAAAYMDFMLHGRRQQSTTTTTSVDGAAAADDNDDDTTRTPLSRSTPTTPRSTKHHEQHYKKLTAAIQAFRKTLERDLWETDDILAQVVASVADLRSRIDLINREIQKRRADNDDDEIYNSHGNNDSSLVAPWTVSWRQMHSHSNNFLLDGDLYLAQQHAIRKHEKALQNLRQLLATLSQQHQALGRRLEEIITLTAESRNIMDDDNGGNNRNGAVVCDQCTRIYKASALDLYTKQIWGQELLGEVRAASRSSSNSNTTKDTDNTLQLATTAAEKIAAQWPRSSSKSPWRNIVATSDFPWTT